MYERMLDKQQKPTYEEFINYLGNTKSLFEQLDNYLLLDLKSEKQLRFPYGNKYGWSMKYFIKRSHICDIFAEKGAFSVMLRLTNKQFLEVYNTMSEYTKQFIDDKYPCGEGGWIHYRVLNPNNLQDIIVLLQLKVGKQIK
ncbi:MAG: DUF3788 domain-containing protein [Eubacteriales bacterium]|nr:DUF3788 domain-containing protein [Eubacteriales bacterium]